MNRQQVSLTPTTNILGDKWGVCERVAKTRLTLRITGRCAFFPFFCRFCRSPLCYRYTIPQNRDVKHRPPVVRAAAIGMGFSALRPGKCHALRYATPLAGQYRPVRNAARAAAIARNQGQSVIHFGSSGNLMGDFKR
jgi:hypothetical protein